MTDETSEVTEKKKARKDDPNWHKFEAIYDLDVGTDEIGEGAVAIMVYGNIMATRLPTLRAGLVRYQLNPETGKSEAVDFGGPGRSAVFISDVDPNKVHAALASIKADEAKMQELYKKSREFRTTPKLLAAYLQKIGG